MTVEQARAVIIAVIRSVTITVHEEHLSQKLARPGTDIAFAELELDSLSAMEMCLELEDKTGIELDLGDLALYPSVNSLAEALVSRIPA